jgi:hypothetical protein
VEEGKNLSPEEILEQIEQKSRKDKLAGLFGTTGNEVEIGIQSAKSKSFFCFNKRGRLI